MTMTATDTHGQGLAQSETIRSAIESIVREVQDRSAGITDIRPPVAELRQSYDAFMKRAGELRGRALYYPYIGSGIGNGALVELMDGSVKWDLISGIGVQFFGHSDPELIQASLEGSLGDTLSFGQLQFNEDFDRFGRTLLELAQRGSRMGHCFLTTSGAMANENAIKVCYQKHAPASRVLAFRDCFMGRTVTMCQIGDTPSYRVGVPLSTLVDYMPFWDEIAARGMGPTRFIDAAVALLTQYFERYPKQHACFIFELVQGEGGFNTAPRDYFKALMECCKSHGVAVWDDEIQTFGRTDRMFAYEALDLGSYVDVLCVGKMTQVCAALWTKDYNPQPGLLSGTFSGTGPGFRAGTRVLERLRDGGYYGENGLIARHFRAFTDLTRALAARHPDWFPSIGAPGLPDVVGGRGGMMRFSPYGGNKDKIIRLCHVLFEEGVIAFYCGHGPYHVRMLPPLGVFNERDWPRVFAVIERAMARVAAETR
ncbi:MAG: aminotransferase class III-fold pyridoxal phosphate-dependent enzyme [Phycisphaerae bacterium]|nr:aminotransferase class III-fold pyridoxal phosphate-dependent enzyme [Phycisphaerae bacterium]